MNKALEQAMDTARLGEHVLRAWAQLIEMQVDGFGVELWQGGAVDEWSCRLWFDGETMVESSAITPYMAVQAAHRWFADYKGQQYDQPVNYKNY